MTLTQTDRLGLPLMAAGQAQKELTHNEALLLLDIAAQTAVESADVATPPSTPAAGQCWIVAPSASGDWAGRDGALAGWTAGGWRFVVPVAGWRAWVADRGQSMRFDGSAWVDGNVRSDGYFVAGDRVLSARQPAVADPGGGSVMDNEARAAIIAVLTALRLHGLIAT